MAGLALVTPVVQGGHGLVVKTMFCFNPSSPNGVGYLGYGRVPEVGRPHSRSGAGRCPPPTHSLHWLLLRWCWQKLAPLHSLHLLLWRWCGQTLRSFLCAAPLCQPLCASAACSRHCRPPPALNSRLARLPLQLSRSLLRPAVSLSLPLSRSLLRPASFVQLQVASEASESGGRGPLGDDLERSGREKGSFVDDS